MKSRLFWGYAGRLPGLVLVLAFCFFAHPAPASTLYPTRSTITLIYVSPGSGSAFPDGQACYTLREVLLYESMENILDRCRGMRDWSCAKCRRRRIAPAGYGCDRSFLHGVGMEDRLDAVSRPYRACRSSGDNGRLLSPRRMRIPDPANASLYHFQLTDR